MALILGYNTEISRGIFGARTLSGYGLLAVYEF
jgi:hypothetical protein